MKKHFNLLLTLILIVLTGCSKDLSRSEAKKILNKEPVPILHEVRLIDYTTCLGKNTREYQYAKNLVDKGYGTIEVKEYVLSPAPRYTFTPNEKLRPFILKKTENLSITLQTGEVTVAEIVGISKDSPSTCIVEYKDLWKQNELGQKLNPIFGAEHVDIAIRKAYFRLYDSGWRRDKEREREERKKRGY
jgi:hypothetical protein